jgi:pteridine reductase
MSPHAPLTGRSVLVTGGAHRVGGAISRHLAARGARVVVHYHRSEAEARALVAALPAGGACFAADLSRPEGPGDLLAAAAAAGERLDALVHTAASFLARPLLETSIEDWDRVMALNLRSTFLLAQEIGRRWSSGGGDLVVIGDAGGVELWTGYFAHTVAKAALIPMVKALAKALAPRIRVNGVMPGPVLPPAGTSEEELARIRERTLLKRLGDPLHVAQAVEFLLICDYATGSWVEVTGGSQLWRGRPADPAAGSGRSPEERAAKPSASQGDARAAGPGRAGFGGAGEG